MSGGFAIGKPKGLNLKASLPRPRTKIASLDEFAQQEWPESICLTCYGVRVGIRVNRKGVLKEVFPQLPPGWKPSRSTAVERLYTILIGAKERGRKARINLLYSDDSRIAGTPKLVDAIDALESDLQLFVAETAPRRVFIHAGVVGLHGKAVVIPGRSFSGKSSLVAALVKAGAIYYSDEYAVIDKKGLVHHYARPLSIRENGHLRKAKRYQVEDLGGRSGVKPLPVGMVVVSKYKSGSRWRPRGLSEGEGALELMSNTVSARRRPAAMLAAIRRVVSVAPVVKGDRGEAGEVVDFIFEKLGRT